MPTKISFYFGKSKSAHQISRPITSGPAASRKAENDTRLFQKRQKRRIVRITILLKKKGDYSRNRLCDPAGARTQDPNIKSVVLYQLSYGISDTKMGIASVLVVQMYGFIFNMQHPTCNFLRKSVFFTLSFATGGNALLLRIKSTECFSSANPPASFSIILISGETFAISATRSSWVLRYLLEHFLPPILPDFEISCNGWEAYI